MKQDFCKDKKVMEQLIQKAQNDDFFRDISDMIFRKENLILSLKKERDEARTDCAVAEKNHINEALRPGPIFHPKAVNRCVGKKRGFSITICACGAHTMEATWENTETDDAATVYIKCLELNEKSFFKYAGEAINRLSEKACYYTGKVVCSDIFNGATNLRTGKIYEIKNGYITDDGGPDMKKRFSTIEELCNERNAKFIPLID